MNVLTAHSVQHMQHHMTNDYTNLWCKYQRSHTCTYIAGKTLHLCISPQRTGSACVQLVLLYVVLSIRKLVSFGQ